MNPTVKAIIIADGAHHLDLRGANKDDPESVIVARQQEVALIREWLDQKENDKGSFAYENDVVKFSEFFTPHHTTYPYRR